MEEIKKIHKPNYNQNKLPDSSSKNLLDFNKIDEVSEEKPIQKEDKNKKGKKGKEDEAQPIKIIKEVEIEDEDDHIDNEVRILLN